MTFHNTNVADLFARLNVRIYDSADKVVDKFDQLMELLNTGEMTDWNATAHFAYNEDRIYIPNGYPDYDRVALHELIHWSGYKTRTGRYAGYHKAVCCPMHAYNLEEMVAEIGSFALCEQLGVTAGWEYKRWLASWRITFRGSQSHTRYEAYAIAKKDAESAVAYILDLAQTERKAA